MYALVVADLKKGQKYTEGEYKEIARGNRVYDLNKAFNKYAGGTDRQGRHDFKWWLKLYNDGRKFIYISKGDSTTTFPGKTIRDRSGRLVHDYKIRFIEL